MFYFKTACRPPAENESPLARIVDAYSAVNANTNNILTLAADQAALSTGSGDGSIENFTDRQREAVAGLTGALVGFYETWSASAGASGVSSKQIVALLEARGEQVARIPYGIRDQHTLVGRTAVRMVDVPDASKESAQHELTQAVRQFAAEALTDAHKAVAFRQVVSRIHAAAASRNLDPRRPFSFTRPQEAIEFLAAMLSLPPEKIAVEVKPTASYDQAAPYLRAAGNDNMLLRSRSYGGFYSVGDDTESGLKLVWLGEGNTGNHLIPEFGSESEDRGINRRLIDELADSLGKVGPASKNILISQVDPQTGQVTLNYYFNTRYGVSMTEAAYQDRYSLSRYTGNNGVGRESYPQLRFSGGSELMEQARREPQIMDDPAIMKQILAELSMEQNCFDLRFPQGSDLVEKIYADPYILNKILFNSDVGYNKLILDTENNRRSGMMIPVKNLLFVQLQEPNIMRSLIPNNGNMRDAASEARFQMGDVYEGIGIDLHNALLTPNPTGAGYVWTYDQPVNVGLYRKVYRPEAPAAQPSYQSRDTRRDHGIGRRGRNTPQVVQQPARPPRLVAVVEPDQHQISATLLRYQRRTGDAWAA